MENHEPPVAVSIRFASLVQMPCAPFPKALINYDDSHEDEGQENGIFDSSGRLVVPVESQQIVEHWRTLEENPGSSLVAVVRAGYELGFESTR